MSYGLPKPLQGPARSLVDFNLHQCTFKPLKQPLRAVWHYSSSKQVFYILWKRLMHIQKSKHISFWPSYCTKPKLYNLLVRPSPTKKWKQTCCHDFFWHFFDDYYSACTYLQLQCFKAIFWRNIFILFFSRQPLAKKRIVLNLSLSQSEVYSIPTLLGSYFGVMGHLWSQNDVIKSWLRLTVNSNCFQHTH